MAEVPSAGTLQPNSNTHSILIAQPPSVHSPIVLGNSSSLTVPLVPATAVELRPSSSTAVDTMSVADRERLLQEQISRLLPTLQQQTVNMASQAAGQQRVMRPAQPSAPHAHAHTHAVPHGSAVPPPVSPASLPLDMSINVDDLAGEVPPHAHSHNTHSPTDGGGGPGGRARRVRRQLGDQIQGVPGLAALLRNLEGAIPFLLLMFTKVMYNHRLGLLVFVAMFGTFYYANSSLKKVIAQRDNQSWAEALNGYVWIFGFLAANIVFVYFVFSDQHLYKCLYLHTPDVGDLDLWGLLWITVITDFIVKFATIAIKSMIAILPKHILAFRKKGKYFLLLETVSQFYRCVLPVPHWAGFMLESKYGGLWVAYCLFILYCVFKAFHVKKKAGELRRAFAQARIDVSFGTAPSRDDVKMFENTCPICQDMYTDPVKLTCKHIFCDDCICLWLDREKTCPMCRAHIVDNPAWRDGATSAVVQFY